MNYSQIEPLDWTILKPQHGFMVSTSPFTMYSGGFGTGKTASLVGKTLALMTLIPHNNGYLARQDGKALRQTTMVDLLEKLPKSWIQSHDVQKGKLQLTEEVGGSQLIYGDLKDIGDLKNHNLGFFGVDQAEEMSWEAWEFLAARLRRKNPVLDPETHLRQYWVFGQCQTTNGRHFALGTKKGRCELCQEALPAYTMDTDRETRLPVWDLVVYPRYGFGVCNTEGPDHWIYQKFNGLPGQDEMYSQGIEGYEAFHATTYQGLEAGFVDKAYVDNLELTYASNPLMYDRYLMGKWVVAEGLVFPSFSKEHHIYDPLAVRHDGKPLLRDWLPVFEYIDPGITAVTAVGWVVVEYCECGCGKPNYWVVDEHYVASEIPEYHCSQIKERRELIGRHVISTEMDTQAFSKSNIQKVTESNEHRLYSLAQLYIEEGIFVRRNQKDWNAGHARLSAAMALDPTHRHPITGKYGAPHFMVSSYCRDWIWECFKYKWKRRKLGNAQTEEPVDRDDHHMDGSISFMAGRPEYRIDEPLPVDTRSPFQKEIEDELDELTGVGVTYDFMEM